MSKEMKIQLSDAEMEAVAGGTGEKHTVPGYIHWVDGDHSKPPVFVSEDEYQAMKERGDDLSHMEPSEISFGKVVG